ncbi:MAG: hypothetical protein C0467_24060 [Planctomycetaceae bacterium]|nr:hypothetical protein [Planctomycetaceae bacterium]
MTLIAFTIPDDPIAVPAWLERRLLSPQFGQFVAELEATYPAYGNKVSARKLLGTWYERAVADGLAGVPPEFLRQLLRHPRTLLEFQETVLTEGGAHWDSVASRANEFGAAAERGRASLDALLDTQAEPAPAPGRRGSNRERVYQRWAIVSTALAACLLVAVGVVTFQNAATGTRGKGTEVAWGWDRAGGIPAAESKPAEYLNGLAKSSEEWFDARPAEAPEVARRINELRAGCSKLILSPHAPLAPADKEWLKAKCREWAGKMDTSLAALEAGADPVQVRGQIDETITRLAKALRERGTQAG